MKGVAYGNALAVYANGKLLTVLKNTDEALEENFLGNVMAVGLRSVGNKTCFSDFGMITDLAKVEEGFGTATLSATVKPSDVGDVTFYDAIGGEALTEEKIAVGTDVKVVVTAAEGKFISSVLINGKTCSLTLDESGSRGEYVFRILENTAFSVTVAGRREVCGNVAVSAKLGVTCDITKTVILVTTAEGTTRIEDGVKADGSFAILVPSEEVTITLSCNGLLVKTYALEAGEERVEDLFCTFDRVAPQTDVALDGMTVGGTADKWTSGENGVTSNGNGREMKYFSQTGSAYTVETEIEDLLHGENGAWSWAGITFRSTGDDTQYAFMAFTTEKEGVDVYELTLVKVDTWEVISWYGVVDVTAGALMKVVNNGSKMMLYFNGKVIDVLTAEKYTGVIGKNNAVGFLTLDDGVTFRDFKLTFGSETPVLQTETTVGGMTVSGTADKWTSGENVVTSSGNGREVKYFSQTGSAYTVTAKIENLLHGENGAWAWAGITFRAAGDDTQYAFMMFTTEKEGVDVYELTLVKVDTWEVISWYGVVDVTADSTMQVSSNGTQITLSFNGTEIATLSITDYASIVGWENAVGLITVDGSVTFRDVRVEIEG